jgi:hypothetical protein
MTPGEKPDAKPIDAKQRGYPTQPDLDTKISEINVKEWASSGETIDKYKQRFKEEWKVKLDQAVTKMINDL